MAIYQLTGEGLQSIEKVSFSEAGFKEREHLQQLFKQQIEVITPDTLVISEEFGNWEDSRRRIDLLGIDKEANLVVIELKRSEDGGHMELQAIRYAAMVSTMTFDNAVDVFEQYLNSLGKEDDARECLLEFLDWEDSDEEQFAQEVRIILTAAEFSKEITSSVLWLNEYGLNIRCIRLHPYSDSDRMLLDIQQVIPLPEAEEYQIRIRDKTRKEKASRTHSRDLTKYDVIVGDRTFDNLPKRWAIFHVISHLCKLGVDPDEIRELISWKRNMLRAVDGTLDSVGFERKLAEQLTSEGKKPQSRRFFTNDDELIHANGKTYAVIKRWGQRTTKAIDLILGKFGSYGISYGESSVNK